MAAASIRAAGVFLVLVPTVAYGGVSLLGFISRRTPGQLDNPVRQDLGIGPRSLPTGALRSSACLLGRYLGAGWLVFGRLEPT
jgi:hypothetical protein